MATEAVKSTQVTNADAGTFNNRAATKGPLFRAAGTLEVLAAAEAGSTYRMIRLPSNAVLSSLKAFNDDLDSNGTPALAVDLGLYKVAADGGAVVDADLFASASTALQAASLTGTELLFESGVVDLPEVNEPLWELLGLSADPQIMYDVTFTSTTAAATGAAGTITLIAEYTCG